MHSQTWKKRDVGTKSLEKKTFYDYNEETESTRSAYIYRCSDRGIYIIRQ
jgi:hypothetical protein